MTNPKLKQKPHSREHRLFESVFNLKLDKYFDLFGLDVLALDEAIGTPEGHSTGSWITEKCDEATTKYIKGLI